MNDDERPSERERTILLAIKRGTIMRRQLVERFGREVLLSLQAHGWIHFNPIVSMTFKAQQWVIRNPF